MWRMHRVSCWRLWGMQVLLRHAQVWGPGKKKKSCIQKKCSKLNTKTAAAHSTIRTQPALLTHCPPLSDISNSVDQGTLYKLKKCDYIIYDLEQSCKQSQQSRIEIMKVSHVHAGKLTCHEHCTGNMYTTSSVCEVTWKQCSWHSRSGRHDPTDIMVTITADWILVTHPFPSEARQSTW